ncbi:MAG: tetratricopeptide repeat protein, partial [Clostridium sp.]
CKRSILENKDYPDNYGFLIPEIMKETGQEKTAEGYFRTALQKEPFNYNMMIKIAEYYSSNSIDNDSARRYYNLASVLKQNDAEIYYNLSTLDILDDEVDNAIKNLNKAIEINPAVSRYHRTIGTIYLNKGDNDKAIESIRNAYGTDKSDALTLNNAGCYYISIEGDIERGMENIKGAYEGINSNMDEETKNTITQNYEKAKELYGKYNLGDLQGLIIPDLTLFY